MNIVFIFVAFFLGVIACVLGLVFASASSDADDLLSESLYVERVVSRLNEETLPEGMGTYPVRTMTINQNEFIEKLIGRLEEQKIDLTTWAEDKAFEIGIQTAISIVDQLAEEYNNGWIPCSERLPEEKENSITHDYMQYPVMVNIGGTLDLRYYYFGNGHWRLGFQIMDKYVTHWMDITPYQPKGE